MVKRKVCGLMTAPRYCNTWARNIIDAAFKESGIPLRVSGGVYYGQCMQRMLEDLIAEGVDLAVTVDFDSIFKAADINRLLSVIESDPAIDALAALQSRRGMSYPLFTVGQKQSVEFHGRPLQVNTAHFGLTAIDLHKLADVPKPWFKGQPAADGGWGDGRIDDDIWFWHQWQNAGLKVFVDSGCRIGHLEEMVSEFDETGTHVFGYPNNWGKVQQNDCET